MCGQPSVVRLRLVLVVQRSTPPDRRNIQVNAALTSGALLSLGNSPTRQQGTRAMTFSSATIETLTDLVENKLSYSEVWEHQNVRELRALQSARNELRQADAQSRCGHANAASARSHACESGAVICSWSARPDLSRINERSTVQPLHAWSGEVPHRDDEAWRGRGTQRPEAPSRRFSPRQRAEIVEVAGCPVRRSFGCGRSDSPFSLPYGCPA